jgi:hypothetical protein
MCYPGKNWNISAVFGYFSFHFFQKSFLKISHYILSIENLLQIAGKKNSLPQTLLVHSLHQRQSNLSPVIKMLVGMLWLHRSRECTKGHHLIWNRPICSISHPFYFTTLQETVECYSTAPLSLRPRTHVQIYISEMQVAAAAAAYPTRNLRKRWELRAKLMGTEH